MRVLVLGGTRFVGPPTVQRLLDLGHEVVLFHRGHSESRPAGQADHIHGDFTNFAESLPKLLDLSPDVVLDTVGRDTLERSYAVVKKGGIIVSIVDEPKPEALEAHGIRGVTLRCTPKAGVLEELSKLMEAKKLAPVISQTFPMTQVVQAQDQIATGHTRGKIVLNIGEDPVRRAR